MFERSAVVRVGDCCAVVPHKVRVGKKGEQRVQPVDKCTALYQQAQGPVFRLQHQERCWEVKRKKGAEN